MNHRRTNRTLTLALVLSAVGPAACGEKSPPPQYVGKTGQPAATPAAPPSSAPAAAASAPHAAPPSPAANTSADSKQVNAAGLTWTVPDPWTPRAPSSSMRLAEMVTPAEGTAEGAQIVTTYFGPQGAGTLIDNMDRWARQVTTESGAPVIPEVKTFSANGLVITLSAATGTFQSGMPGQTATPKHDWTLIGAVVEQGPQGPVYFKMDGPKDVVAANRERFITFLKSIRKVEQGPRVAKQPDRHDLYERAVQSPTMQAKFLRALHPAPDSTPLTLGEDFCAAAAISRAWVSLYASRACRAVCVDRDAEPLARLRELATPAITIHHADVLDVSDPIDILAVLNFSICERRTRAELLSYLRHARARMNPGAILVIDLYAGVNAHTTGESEQDLRGPAGEKIRYVWEQREANPLTGRVTNAMHFFPAKGAPLRDAFVYDWRLWSPPELRDALAEAGFMRTDAYNSLGDAIDGDGRIHAMPIESPDDLDDDFVIYLVARTPDSIPQ